VGDGDNGKGVFLRILTELLGPENCAHQSLDELRERFGLQPLIGKMANLSGDQNELDRVGEGILKRLTGQDSITVDRKNLPQVTMIPTAKLIFAANTLPLFRDKSEGVWRRLFVIPFRVAVSAHAKDSQLTEKLKAELPGILGWVLRGLQRLLHQGGLTDCAVCAAAKSSHRYDCDPLAQFLDTCVVTPQTLPRGCPAGRLEVDAPALYAAYQIWCSRNGREPMSSNFLTTRLKKIPGITHERRRTVQDDGTRPYFFTGLALATSVSRTVPEEPQDDEGDGDDGGDEEGDGRAPRRFLDDRS
jgi:putative DNA primase/helicase